MALDIVPIPGVMTKVSGVVSPGISGEPLIQGQAVYQDDSTKQWFRSNAVVVGAQNAAGIVMATVAGQGQSVPIMNDPLGQLKLGCIILPGVIYIASANYGGICPYVDGVTPASGWQTCIIGMGINENIMQLIFRFSGVTHA